MPVLGECAVGLIGRSVLCWGKERKNGFFLVLCVGFIGLYHLLFSTLSLSSSKVEIVSVSSLHVDSVGGFWKEPVPDLVS